MSIDKIQRQTISPAAIGIVGLTAFGLSLFYYSPLIFGPIWMTYRNTTAGTPMWTMIFAPLRELIAAYVLGFLIYRLDISDWKRATLLILLLWTAFHAVGMAGAVIWDNMPWQLGMVHAGDWLMKMIFMGIALTIWKNRQASKYVHA